MCIQYLWSFVPCIADEAWEIDKSQLTLGKELGSGQFGVRYNFMFLYCIPLSFWGSSYPSIQWSLIIIFPYSEWLLGSGNQKLTWPSRWWERDPWTRMTLLKRPQSWSTNPTAYSNTVASVYTVHCMNIQGFWYGNLTKDRGKL